MDIMVAFGSRLFCICIFSVFFFFSSSIAHVSGDKVTVHALFMGPSITLFKKNIKNWSHGTIHGFKNYFATVFLIFSKINCIQMNPISLSS